MKTINPQDITVALLPKGVLTFAAIIRKLEADPDLSDLRKRDLISGLRRVSNAVRYPPEEMIADPKWLRPHLSNVSSAALGLTKKSWQNVVSDARAALAHFGIVMRRTRQRDELQEPWQDLWLKVRALGDINMSFRIRRFLQYLNNLGIEPQNAMQSHADTFLEAIKADEIAKRPEVVWRDAVNAWNAAASQIDGWPELRLVLPKRANLIKLPDRELPLAFLSDLDAFMRRQAAPDPFADDAPRRPLSASTITQRTGMLKRFVSELLLLGVPKAELASVAGLCAPALAKRGLHAMVGRNGNKSSVNIENMADILVSCAKALGLPKEDVSELANLARRVALPTQHGMTRKNRDRLRVLRDDATLRRLLDLPDVLSAMGGNLRPEAAALALEDALAIAILLVCPIRIGNLASIRIDRHLKRPSDGRVFLVFSEDEVKNRRPIEFELPSDVRRLLDKHLAGRAPLLCPTGTPWLFPRRNGTEQVNPSTLSTRLKLRIHRETGIVMHMHLFRHLAAMIYLEAEPGSYEAVRRLLGHSSSSTAINLYTGLETGAVFETFGHVLSAKRRGK